VAEKKSSFQGLDEWIDRAKKGEGISFFRAYPVLKPKEKCSWKYLKPARNSVRSTLNEQVGGYDSLKTE